MNDLIPAIDEAVTYVNEFLDDLEQEETKIECPQDMYNHILAVLDECKKRLG